MASKVRVASRADALAKHVCMIAYTSYQFDGRVRLEAESLVRWGYAVTFLVPKRGDRAETFSLEGVTVRELNVRKIRDHSKLRYLISYAAFLVYALIACTDLFVRSKVKIVHVHNMPNILILAAIIPRLFGCKLILDLHDTVPETYQAKFGKTSRIFVWLLCLEEQICCRIAHRVICVNHVQRLPVIARGTPGKKIATVITMPTFVSLERAPRSIDSKPTFRLVNHGTMSRRLGNDLILEAAVRLKRKIMGFELHIIGGGENLNELQQMSKTLDIQDCVQFHPGVPWDKLATKLQDMDAGIVANRVNVATALMLPSKLIDYTVLGIPAIVPRLEAIQYYFSDEMVSYFEPENVDSMVDAVLTLYNDPERMKRQPLYAKRFLVENPWDGPNGLKGLYENLSCESRQDRRAIEPNIDIKVS